jgi:uncharacterized membrane protein
MPAAPRYSAAAVASLVLGILGCVPLITSMLAIVFGIAGLRATGSPHVQGRGLAIAGLVLGCIGVLGWGGGGAGVWGVWVHTHPERILAEQFINNLSQGNITAASAQCTNNVSKQQLIDAAAKLQGWGPLFPARATQAGFNFNNGSETGNVIGQIILQNGPPHTFVMGTAKQQGQWKVDSFNF